MGLRGINARPVLPKEKGQENSTDPALTWQKKGLSRPERVIKFIESLEITSGFNAGKRFKLRPWQKRIIRAIYRTKKGKRQVRQALVSLPRKQGKSVLSSALALAHLCGPEAESRGQVLSAASDRDQAAIIFNEMCAFIQADEYLSERVIIRQFKKELEDVETGSTYKPLTADGRKAHGLNPSFVVCDELAQWKGRELYDNLSTGSGARAEPLQVVISTASSDPNHIMTELVNYGRKVQDGVIEDPAFYACIYEAPLDADPWDEAVWYDCNPALGDFRSLEEMRKFAEQARQIPAKEAAFRNLYLNQPVDPEQRFIATEDWKACGDPVDPEELRGCKCWAGLDLGSTQDLTALVLYFPEQGGQVLPFFWVPGENLRDREDKDKVPYLTWRKQGFIESTNGRAIDKRAIAQRLAEITADYDVQGVAYDRWRIEDLKHILTDEGIDLPLVPWGQGFKDMAPAVDELESKILDKKLRHGNHPVLTWNCANCVVQLDPAGQRKIAKDKSIDRVDGMVALVMALGLYSREPAPVELDFTDPVVLEV